MISSDVTRVYKTIKNFVIEEVPMTDLVTIKEAADISGYSMSGIMRKMDNGSLPVYQYGDPSSQTTYDMQRLTSRKAVEALPKARGGRLVSFAAAKNNPKRLYSPRYFQSTPLLSKVTSSFQSRLPLFSAN